MHKLPISFAVHSWPSLAQTKVISGHLEINYINGKMHSAFLHVFWKPFLEHWHC